MTWENGGLTNVKTAYEYELGANKINKTYNAKIGLIYLSEYYYSASPDNWTKLGWDSTSGGDKRDYRSATSQNWMYMGGYEWTISPLSDIKNNAFRVGSAGGAGYNGVLNSNDVRPTFSLNSDVELLRGTGTKSDPMRIKI